MNVIIRNGIAEISLKNWDKFNELVCDPTTFLEKPHYVYRGQRKDSWPLEPSIARVKNTISDAKSHLDAYRYAIRGRRGNNPHILDKDDDVWALGQHHGLFTPLLDWTASPYVALFFAFAKEDKDGDKTEFRVVYALNEQRINERGVKLEPDDKITFLRPLSDENGNLISQAGLFTKSPIIDITKWVEAKFPRESTKVILSKISISNTNREGCLRALNRMNINHATLFPNLYGAGQYANLKSIIKDY